MKCAFKSGFYLGVQALKYLTISKPFLSCGNFQFLMVCCSIYDYRFKNKFSKGYAKTIIFSRAPWNSCRSLNLASTTVFA